MESSFILFYVAFRLSHHHLLNGLDIFLCIFLVPLLLIDLFRFSISSWLSLIKLYVSRNLSAASRALKFWCVIVHNILLRLHLLSLFFLVSLAQGLLILSIFSKKIKKLLLSLISNTVFLVSVSFISILIVVILHGPLKENLLWLPEEINFVR